MPHEKVDLEYDYACKKVKEVESSLTKHLKNQQKLLGDASVRIFSQTVWSLNFSSLLLCLFIFNNNNQVLLFNNL